MAVNKVETSDGRTIMDLTGDSVKPENVDEGVTFHDATGEQRTGTKSGDVSAGNVYFTDGETFQQKYDAGELTGPTGPAGYTPQRGTDYWTAADQAQMVQDVLTALPTWTGGEY